MDIIANKSVPIQRLSTSKKTDNWGKDVIEYYTNTLLIEEETVRKNKKTIEENYDLIIGKLDPGTLSRTFNPMKLQGEQTLLPTENEVISIIRPALKTLIGEEYNRPFEYRVFVTNPDAISQKEENLRKDVNKKLADLVLNSSLSEEERTVRLQKIQQWKTHTAQDIRERAASHLLNHYYNNLDLRRVFNKGWKDVLAAGEEIYRIDLVNGNPVVVKCNPLEIYTLRSADSSFIEDSDVIVEDTYMSPGAIIDEFYDRLSNKDIKYIYNEDGYVKDGGSKAVAPVMSWNVDADSLIEIDVRTNIPLSNRSKIYRTKEGNVRVMRVYWKSLRKIGFLSYFDELTGEQLEKVVDEFYKADVDKGETIEWMWISEWWQGIRIGEDIFIDIKPCDVQRRDMNNISICKPPFVGTVYNYGDREVQSLVDELKPIQYEWMLYSKKASLLWSRNYGKLVKLDVSKIPDNFDLDLFMTWIQSFGIIVEDPFKEGAKGQQSGQYQSSVSSVDLELSTSINAVLNYMMYLRELAEDMTGITRQRRGELLASEGLGVTQQGIMMSSKLTEELFKDHEYTKQRVLEALLEVAKFSLRSRKNKKLQYILDDLSYAIYDLDTEGFADADYGLKIADGSKLLLLEQQYTTLAHAALQSGTLSFSQLLEAERIPSVSSKIARLKSFEEEAQLAKQKEQEYAMKMQQQQQEMEMQLEQMKMQHEMTIEKMKGDNKLQVERMKIQSGIYNNMMGLNADDNRNGINDDIEIEKQEMVNKQKDQELAFKKKKWEDEKKIKNKELEIKRKAATKKPTK